MASYIMEFWYSQDCLLPGLPDIIDQLLSEMPTLAAPLWHYVLVHPAPPSTTTDCPAMQCLWTVGKKNLNCETSPYCLRHKESKKEKAPPVHVIYNTTLKLHLIIYSVFDIMEYI